MFGVLPFFREHICPTRHSHNPPIQKDKHITPSTSAVAMLSATQAGMASFYTSLGRLRNRMKPVKQITADGHLVITSIVSSLVSVIQVPRSLQRGQVEGIHWLGSARRPKKTPNKAGLNDTIVVRCPPARGDSRNGGIEEAENVIDLGAPRRVKRAPAENISGICCGSARVKSTYTPNPRLAHFRLRALDTDSGASSPVANHFRFEVPPPQVQVQRIMEAANRHSTSPEDCSDGNEPTSAPSEFLAEFLSAIMRRQYAEALKYCRLILQYEPNNTTARGFYPLLRQKLETQKKSTVAEAERGSSSEESHNDASVGKKVERRRLSEKRVAEESMQQEADDSPSEECVQSRSRTHSEGSCASQSSLELDSSDAVAHSSPSISFSRRTEQTDSASGSGAWCVSAGSAGSGSRSDPDDNGNQTTTFTYQPGDVENDNAAASGEPHPGARLKKDTSSLQRLRAQFACSIK
ncbi:hypothetical protein K1T71_006434 [Dendrolimus kikuchii]|uniref:Uncharacterized protein n=1 Tax=Dendrolimus kikuchii TaxID=765133 RepID=A0ACC1D145_9NEOP|nr:hypothetical protein K1T71_006434 [Dendrolimus kikuchii]